jgi:hypothetical protein
MIEVVVQPWHLQYGFLSASFTHHWSHLFVQQNWSSLQTAAAHVLQLEGSTSPAVHSLCVQLLWPS